MRILGFEITRAGKKSLSLAGSGYDRGWFPVVRESFTGAWQRGEVRRPDTLATYHAAYSCITLIAADIAKMNLRLMEKDDDGIWSEVSRSSPYAAVLRKPNRYQHRANFMRQWVISKLVNGNAYVLPIRDDKGIVTEMYVLDPFRTRPLVAPDGSIYYSLSRDPLSRVEDSIVVPGEKMIHDVMNPIYHPLCGVPPLVAAALAATTGQEIQTSQARFFANGATPGGVLTAPGHVGEDTARRLKEMWEERFRGENLGRVAILGDGLKYEQMMMRPVDAQLVDQLKWSAETICSTFHVPKHKAGIGDPPAHSNIEVLDQQYYSQALQGLIEDIELCLDQGLGLPDVPRRSYGVEFDIGDLLRMDTATLTDAAAKAVGAGIMTPNEARARFDLPPKQGGDSPYMQQQNYSLEALAARDRAAASIPAAPSAPSAAPSELAAEDDPAMAAEMANMAARRMRALLGIAA